MKKIQIGLLLATLLITMSACGSGDTKDSSATTEPKAAASSTKESKAPETATANQAVVDKLKKDFDSVNVEVEKDVVDSESNDPHEVINVSPSDEETRKGLQQAQDAINSNTADDTQKITIAGIQTIVSEAAKNLAGENDAIQFKYVDSSNNNNMVVAYSTKSKDIIPIVK